MFTPCFHFNIPPPPYHEFSKLMEPLFWYSPPPRGVAKKLGKNINKVTKKNENGKKWGFGNISETLHDNFLKFGMKLEHNTSTKPRFYLL
jgi:hypothetical protein